MGALSTVSSDPLLLVVAGPVIEKIGFFANSSREAVNIYRTTPVEERNPAYQYVQEAIKNGLPNLMKDIVVHDPLYTILMLLEIQQFPETPVWMLSVIAFLLSVAAIASGEVITKEALYKLQKERLKQSGFSLEKHLEARFIVQNTHASQLLQELAIQFDLGDIHTSQYVDTYFPTNLPAYNGRQPIVRSRWRREEDSGENSEEIQVVYTRSSQLRNGQPEQYNYFPENKDKFKFPFDNNTQKVLKKITTDMKGHQVRFTRDYAHIPGKLLISTDQVNNGDNSYTVVEIKSYREEKDAVQRMIQVMRHVMSKYDVVQTTHSKRILTGLR